MLGALVLAALRVALVPWVLEGFAAESFEIFGVTLVPGSVDAVAPVDLTVGVGEDKVDFVLLVAGCGDLRVVFWGIKPVGEDFLFVHK